MRHTRPASGPSPPPISMPYSASSVLRTTASSTPAGTRTQFNVGSRCPACAWGAHPSDASPAMSAALLRGGRGGPRAPPPPPPPPPAAPPPPTPPQGGARGGGGGA